MTQNLLFEQDGFEVLHAIYEPEELSQLISMIESKPSDTRNFRKTSDLFAIRQFMHEVPEAEGVIFNRNLKEIIRELLGENAFLVKSIYFDKVIGSNWFVASHQDLTIAVQEKKDVPGFVNWTIKDEQYAVQPPLDYLENILTIRIHLDDTDASNGALQVLRTSHKDGIQRYSNLQFNTKNECICDVPAGGVMLMKPLLFHRSARSTGISQRRVIHLEFTNLELPEALTWSEKRVVKFNN